ncbi:Apolipoprotein N-acyltransferase [Spirochaeta thermophila DSM 6578]|uniref:Apolipoprotein N-acyltransferase n=2 Tax=Winmispira thermophila TaxID=154 RepID=G0GD83_WINT7|nr:Apolipoprotein N-acyltransferase [Spirochaeta thermophila DSM 6578]
MSSRMRVWCEGRTGGGRFCLLVVSSILFALSFPNHVVLEGIPLLAYVALVPVFPVVRYGRWFEMPFYGIFYGFLSYALFNYWLAPFHPLAIIIVPVIYATYFLMVFPLLKLADVLFPRRGYLVQTLVWIGYEYLKTTGFLGYAYGIMGYSQYAFLPLIQIADVTGVWGVSLLVVFPSAFLGWGLMHGVHRLREWCARERWVIAGYGLLLLVALVYGLFAPVDYSTAPRWKVALVQHDKDPWKGGLAAYRDGLERLMRLSDEALEEDPRIEAVVWSETAFVPSIYWHLHVGTDPESTALVNRLLTYLDSRDPVVFVFGNDDGRPVKDAQGRMSRVDYNAVYVWKDGELLGPYRKIHLVPFTEHFPYERQLPGIYQWLKNADTHFWEKGSDYTVFDLGKVRLSTLVCFEDTFGYLSREFVRRGAEVLVNLTNDSWSGLPSNAMQHMTISVFRAVENRRSLVRSTNGGITTAISPNGEILASLPPFVQDYLVCEVPVFTGRTTLYTRWGDWFAWFVLSLASLLLAGGLVFRLGRRLLRSR